MKQRMIKYWGSILLVVGLCGILNAQEGGIRFEHGSWAEAKEKARQENKLIFVDFYTEWCGPCLAMAEEVFPLMEVGNFYNTHFVNLKVDAEKGDGRTLREKYNVVSYPTFVFIDPVTEKVVHRSSSRQEAETFLFTGKSVVTPTWRSPYLQQQYEKGNRSREFLSQYMDYLASMYQRDKVNALVEEYTRLPDFSLSRKEDWQVFLKHISGTESSQFQALLAEKAKYEDFYGEKAVEDKIYKEFNLSADEKALEKAPDFRGKDFLLRKNRAEQYVRSREYEKAAPLLNDLMKDPGEFKEELCHYLKFVARTALYGEPAIDWLKQCTVYAQYVAYNSYNRQDAGIHYDYAQLLEKLIRCAPDAGKYFPASILEVPENGVKNYSMRSPKLKAKPKRK